MDKKIGFIGCGHMASSMIRGILSIGLSDASNILASAAHEKSIHGIRCITDNKHVAKNSDILILAVRPNMFETVISEIKDCVKDDVVIVSVAAGISLVDLKKMFGRDIKYVRAMPNTPAEVGEGMSALCGDTNDDVIAIFESFGKCEVVGEDLIDAVIADSGSSPAYVYMLIEAMAKKSVELGMSEELALEFAAQAVLGSAKLVQESGELPADLCDKICTPGGTTIEAVNKLKDEHFEEILGDAMQACYDKSKNM